MTPLRALLGAVSLSLAACAASPSFPTASSLPDAQRLPDGVALDVPLELPPTRTFATGGSVAVLRQPVDSAAIASVLTRFFDAMVAEDAAALTQVLDASATYRSRGGGGQSKLLEVLRARMRSMDYGRLAGAEFARIDALERRDSVREPERGESASALADDGELELRVPISTARFSGERLFGEIAVFVVRPERDRGVVIVGYSDDSSP